MRSSPRLACERLEDRTTPALAFTLSGVGPGIAFLTAFDTADPATGVAGRTVSDGLGANDVLVGLDVRPQDGGLYALGVNAAADTATLYRISTATGVATAIGGVGAITGAGDLQPPSATVGYGVDFNPTVDRLRVVSGSLNFRVNPNTGTLVMADTPLSGGSTTDDATAYTNSVPGATVTTQYTLDQATNSLYIQGFMGAGTPAGPNGGVLGNALPVRVNGQPLDFTAVSGFDIPPDVQVTASNTAATGLGFAALTVGSDQALYRIDLATGAATRLSTLFGTVGLAVSDGSGGVVDVVSGSSGLEGGVATVVLARVGGTGAQTVTVVGTATLGTNIPATPGADFDPGPYFVTFAPGQTTTVLSVPLATDGVAEGLELFTLTITDASTGLIGTQSATSVFIGDTPPPRSLIAVGAVADGIGVQITYADGNVDGFLIANPAAMPVAAAVVGDINGDGRPEVAILLSSGLISLLDPATLRLIGLLGDINGDGAADLAYRTFDAQGVITAFFFDGRTGRLSRLA